MEVVRYKYIFMILAFIVDCDCNENAISTKETSTSYKNADCPFTKIIKEVFNIHNKSADTGIYLKDTERVKLLLDTLSNVTNLNDTNSALQDEIVDSIIASINKIKNNFTLEKNNDTKLNEAIIINVPKEKSTEKNPFLEFRKVTLAQIKSGIEDKIDTKQPQSTTPKNIIEKVNVTRREDTIYNITKNDEVTYVEILTIEPNNTNPNNTSKNIIDILKHIMPMFNSSLTKNMQNITFIERHGHRNQTITALKNVSTIVVTFCDNENYTKIDLPIDQETIVKLPVNETLDYDDPDREDDDDDDELTNDEKNDILEAADYGMQKMHELYSVMEPKLYSMGLWLDETNPARYVAAFNAPSEDAIKFSRYGYASLQAATRLKQLISGSDDGAESRTEEMQFPKASALRQSPLLQQCPLRGTPKCPPASKRYRTHDGTCNNLSRLRWGSTMTPVQRFLPPSYSDDLQAPRRSVTGTKLPSAREISSHIHEDRHIENHGITHLLMQWGQFLDHDVTSTSQSRGFNGSVPRCCKDGGRDFVPKELMHPECFPIAVPPSDPFYGPLGVRCLDFVRSSPAPRDDCSLGWREQLNQVSVFIDGSPLYGSSARKSDNLRLFRNGMLQYGRVQQRRPLLPPERRDELCHGGAISADCFKSGDARVNEHPGLVAAHIVWLRLHNRMAQELAHLNPHWSDEKIYQETRKIVGAMLQHITYKEFLPIVLGEDVMRLFELELLNKGFFKNYDPKVNPSIAGSFGSAAFRFGHSLVQASFMRYDRFHRPMKNNVSLHDEITNPSNIWSMGAVDRLLFGMFNQPIQDRDEFMTEELTNHLFQTPQFKFGMDLAAINIQRGRDHGIPPYTSWREPCGLSPILEFEDLFRVMPARVARKIQMLYRHVDDIDLFTGGLAERPVVGGLVGPTFACIIAQQFSNLRKGDRFWYENGGFDSSFTPAQLQQIRRISFAQVLCRTLDTIDSVQPFVFLTSDFPDNERISCMNGLLNNFDLSPWIELNSDFENDIGKSIVKETKTESPKTNKQTNTTIKSTDTIMDELTFDSSNLSVNRSSEIVNATKEFKPYLTSTINSDSDSMIKNTTSDKMTISKLTPQIIDDKLDFKNKSRRYDTIDRLDTRGHQYRPTEEYDDYDEDNIQSVQSVVINNLNNKRPYNRPVISVTERLDKFTYLINYVPKSTQSWRHTTKSWRQTTRPWRQTTKKTQDRDIVKVTYQNYDDTYRRPTNYYYNRQDNDKDSHRHNTPEINDSYFQSARSNDKVLTTNKPTATDSTLSEWQKLVTFGYIGTYKADNLTMTTPDKLDHPHEDVKDSLSKDFSTEPPLERTEDLEEQKVTKLSTFFLFDTVTKPFNLDRPTRRHDEEQLINIKPNKYYYIKNVLHKYPDSDLIGKDKLDDKKTNKPIVDFDNLEHSIDKVEDRSGGVMGDLDEAESKSAKPAKLKLKTKKPGGPPKTPSVAFQVIPSENSPSNWAVYEENQDIVEKLHKMPSIINNVQAQGELPRPLLLTSKRKGRS